MIRLTMAACAAAMTFSGAALAAEPGAVAPMAAFLGDLGGKQVVGYYTAEAEACQVTLMVAETPDEAMTAPLAARVRFALTPSTSATVESAEGGRLAVTCEAGAKALLVDSSPAPRHLASR